jgi:opacity protein-like surface antigen
MKKISIFVLMMVLFSTLSSYSQTPLTIKLTGGMNGPMGDFSKVYKSGASVEAGIFYSLPFPGLDLTFTAGYNGFKYKNDYFTGLVSSNLSNTTVDNFGFSWTATDIPVMVGAKYMLPVGSMKPYVTGEVGLHFMSFSDRFNGQKLIGNSSTPTSFSYNGATESGSEIGVGTTIGAGIEVPLVPKISLDLNVKYYYAGIKYSKSFIVFKNNNEQFTTTEMKNLNYFTIRGGIVISL